MEHMALVNVKYPHDGRRGRSRKHPREGLHYELALAQHNRVTHKAEVSTAHSASGPFVIGGTSSSSLVGCIVGLDSQQIEAFVDPHECC